MCLASGMAKEKVFELLDERSLNAMAHPLRMRLLVILRSDGPATATRLAERVGEPQLLFDPQTAGGLLFGLPASRVE